MSKKLSKRQDLPVLNPNVAGIDIGSGFHMVAIPPDRRDEPVKISIRAKVSVHLLAI